MGSGNSSPVKQAKNVDMFEVRFDHLAVGGTAFVFLFSILGLYWLYHKRQRNKNRSRQRRRQGCERSRERSRSPVRRHACCHSQQPWYPMMPFLPPMMNSQSSNPWIPMDVLRQPIYDTPRFTEIQETRAPAQVGQPPARPLPLLRCPSPHPRTTEEST